MSIKYGKPGEISYELPSLVKDLLKGLNDIGPKKPPIKAKAKRKYRKRYAASLK